MKTINVELTGTSPLLMNNPASMIDEASGISKTTERRDIKAEAKKLAYVLDDGELYVPGEAIKGCLIASASYKKIGKYSAKPIISGGIQVRPRKIGLGTKDYEVDIRTVVIQRRNRVVKGRPVLENWKLKFQLVYDDTLINDTDIIKAILDEGGKRVGILDFRPAKNGDFGMFEISKWEPDGNPVKQTKQKR